MEHFATAWRPNLQEVCGQPFVLIEFLSRPKRDEGFERSLNQLKAMTERISLLEPGVEKKEKSHVLAITIAGVVIALGIVLWFTFRYYPEKKATQEFFEALVAGNTQRAYTLWKPTPSYKIGDFLADWGPTGYYGPIKSFKIMDARAPNKSDSIAVNVAISPYAPMPESNDAEKSSKTRVVTLWISPSDKSFSFPP